MNELYVHIKRVISRQLRGKMPDNVDIRYTTSLNDIGADSLDIMEIIISLENLEHKKVPDVNLSNIETVQDIYDLFKE